MKRYLYPTRRTLLQQASARNFMRAAIIIGLIFVIFSGLKESPVIIEDEPDPETIKLEKKLDEVRKQRKGI